MMAPPRSAADGKPRARDDEDHDPDHDTPSGLWTSRWCPPFIPPIMGILSKKASSRATGAIEDRTMTLTLAEPIHRAPTRVAAPVVEESRDVRYDPAGFGAALREVAARAHRAVRALDGTSGRGAVAATAADPLRELSELHPRIVQLQRCLDAESQHGLASYLSALRREVELRLR